MSLPPRAARTALRHLVVLSACISACIGVPAGPQGGFAGDGDRVLFIGNSHTYVNDVPGLVQAFADSAGAGEISTGSIAKPGYALIDHYLESPTRTFTSRCDGITHLVLQQGWTPGGVYRDTLTIAAKGFAELVARCNTKVVLYQVWPLRSQPQYFPLTIESFAVAARESRSLLAPVAQAWELAISRGVTAELWDADGLHASPAGSYLAALVLYERIVSRSPVGLPATVRTRSGTTITLAPELARLLQQAAADVVGAGQGGS